MENRSQVIMKALAMEWYAKISKNDILKSRIRKKFPNCVVLTVHNKKAQFTGEVFIRFNWEDKTMQLCSDVGLHAETSF